MDAELIVRVEELTCGYGRARVLDQVSLEIHKGEILAIIGKSGCGKTTLMKTMIGLLPYRKGSVKLMDVEIRDRAQVEKRKILRRIGVLFQRGALLNSMTVAENVMLPLEMHTAMKIGEMKALAAQRLADVGLLHALDKFPTELSGGMVKRAALARALSLEPEILFCDEPSAGLDPVTARGLDELLLEEKQRLSMTMVVVTHDVASIRRIADRVVMLDQGRLVFDGTQEQAAAADLPALRDFFSAS